MRAVPEVASTHSTINTGSGMGKHKAAILVGLAPPEERKHTSVMLAEPIRQRLAAIPGIDISIIQETLGGGASPIQLSVLGDDRAVLEKVATDLAAGMRLIPGMVDINSSTADAKSILSVRLKREQASDLGVGVPELAGTLAPLVAGAVVSTWTDARGESHDIVVRLPHDQRANPAAIKELTITTPGADANGNPLMARLDQVAEIEQVPGASGIRRLGLSQEVLISADVSGRAVGDVMAELEALIAAQDLPTGYRIKFGGDAEDIGKAGASMLKALIMAVIFIYVVLASQFGSFTQPLAIMAALPLSLAGVLLGLMIAGSTFNMFSMSGFIMLMGMVAKNACRDWRARQLDGPDAGRGSRHPFLHRQPDAPAFPVPTGLSPSQHGGETMTRKGLHRLVMRLLLSVVLMGLLIGGPLVLLLFVEGRFA
ncbi:efflux RND transporter permease subunit [Mesorhizobium sp. ASY16-5R]|uniref:efflux RND transporter permease subunit n=1 Tax=Mesorhizobium sp. ASY16-5R TaxID=3445772 RepID=UPI003FA026A7